MKPIPCLHESGEVAVEEQISDHHPLTREEIARLLAEAKTANTVRGAQIQVRLCQGIRGYTCPRAIDGPVAEKELELTELYIDNLHKGGDPALVEQLYRIMVR